MAECQHQWEMWDVRFGFIVFEKCFHCNGVRTYFCEGSPPAIGIEYREENCFWSCVETAQFIRLDLRCTECSQVVDFHDLMGLLHCTECQHDCDVAILQNKLEADKTWLIVAFGFLPQNAQTRIPQEKLEILTDYFNQRRDTGRSRIKVVTSDLINDISRCKGELIHDIGMLSQQEVTERESLF
ncbi:MAG: hypothetical protein KOO63_16535 [Bacteroidales bacterium]|nr:hypothetical protein [Candidatus Latescibacterota bacterium]